MAGAGNAGRLAGPCDTVEHPSGTRRIVSNTAVMVSFVAMVPEVVMGLTVELSLLCIESKQKGLGLC
jgi:hypothetical protein